MKAVAPGIHEWSVFNEEKGLDFNGHCVTGARGGALVDPPPMDAATLAAIEAIGPPSVIIITNAHHGRDAMTFASRWKIPIVVPESDADRLPPSVRIGGIYRDGDELPGGLTVIGLPDQKTPGESALLCPSAGALILGDALIGKPAGALSMLPAAKYADAGRAREGLRRLLDLDVEVLLLGDGASIRHDARAALLRFFSS